MTGPRFDINDPLGLDKDWAPPQETPSSVFTGMVPERTAAIKPQPKSIFSGMTPEKPQPTGTFSRMWTVENNIAKYIGTTVMNELYNASGGYGLAPDPHDVEQINAGLKSAPVNFARAIRDIVLENPATSYRNAMEAGKNLGVRKDGTKMTVGEALLSVPEGIFGIMAATPFSTLTGIAANDPNFRANTDAEQIATAREFVGNAVGAAVGGLTRGIVSTALEDLGTSKLIKIEKATSTVQPIVKFQTRALGLTAKIGEKAVIGTAEGFMFGTAQAITAYGNKPEMMAQAVLNNLVFAPAGFALEIFRPVEVGPTLSRKAQVLSQIRQLQIADDVSLANLTKDVVHYSNANSLLDGILSAKIDAPRSRSFVVNGVTDLSIVGDYIQKQAKSAMLAAAKIAQGYTDKVASEFDTTPITRHADGITSDITPGKTIPYGTVIEFGGREFNYAPREGKARNNPDLHSLIEIGTGKKVNVPTDALIEEGQVVTPAKKVKTPIPPTAARDFSVHKNSNGSYDVLFHGTKSTKLGARSFIDTGFMHNEPVSYNGQTYLFNASGKGDALKYQLKDPLTSKVFDVAPQDMSRIRRISTNVIDGETISVSEPRSTTDIGVNLVGDEVPPEAAPKSKKLYTVGVATTEEAQKKLFTSFTDALLDLDAKDKSSKTRNIGDITLNEPLETLVTNFATRKGFTPDQIPSLMRDFEKRLFQEMVNNSDPDTVYIFDQLGRQAEKYNEQRAALKEKDRVYNINDLIKTADSNGMFVEQGSGSTLLIRDTRAGSTLATFNNIISAVSWVDNIGQMHMDDLARGVFMPLRHLAGMYPPNHELGGPKERVTGPEFIPRDGISRTIAGFSTMAEYFSPIRRWMSQLDDRLYDKSKKDADNPRFYPIFVNGDKKVRIRNVELTPWADGIDKIEKRAGLNKEAAEHVGGWIETASLAELEALANKNEITYSEGLAKYDISKLYAYRDALVNLEKAYPTEPSRETDDYKAQLKLAKSMLGITAEDETGFHLLQGILTLNRQEVNVGHVMRMVLTRRDESTYGMGMTRDEYAKAHDMSPKALQAGKELEELLGRYADYAGIPKSNRIFHYMSHARIFNKGEISAALEEFGNFSSKEAEFYAKLERIGQLQALNAYEKNPFISSFRYMKAGIDAVHLDLSPEVQMMNENLLLTPNAERAKTKTVISRYFQDLKGIPGESDRFAQNYFGKFIDNINAHVEPKLGVKLPDNVKRNVVNVIIGAYQAGAQGFRLVAGMRDFYSAYRAMAVRTSFSRTAKALIGVLGDDQAWEGISNKMMEKMGLIQHLQPIYIESPIDAKNATIGQAAGTISKGYKKFLDFSLAASLQNPVYKVFQAALYKDGIEHNGMALSDYVRDNDFEKLQTATKLRTFDFGAQREFVRILNEGGHDKYTQAAHFLALEQVKESLYIYANANHPSGWGRNVGKLAGNFGSWSTHQRNFMVRAASQGTVRERMSALGKMAAFDAALAATSVATGYNLNSWMSVPGAAFAGGPMTEVFKSIMDITASGFSYGGPQAFQELVKSSTLVIPGSMFARNVLKAGQLSDEGANAVNVAGQFIGIPQQTDVEQR